ncbi:hypothetical protein IV417_02655 [Alphaproteobacteria bacterium KMM 3653]|uniref:Uncharacterized protein n=1 Tax=Harenicola maris TaxID=2841044 RepID=A0AAP2G2R4_9RHOB|nr:hypothetical protein [Harenicola maris]
MLEFYIAQMEQSCGAAIVRDLREMQINAAESWSLIYDLEPRVRAEQGPCLGAFAGYLAYSLDGRTPVETQRSFMSVAMAVPVAEQGDLREAMGHAWGQIAYEPAQAQTYFQFAGVYGLQVPAELALRLSEQPVFGHRDEAFHYHRYLLMLGEVQGARALGGALEAASGDVDALGALVSGVASTGILMKKLGRDTSDAARLLAPYREDRRRMTGVNGPGSGGAPADVVGPFLRIIGG